MYCAHVIGRGDLNSDSSMLTEMYNYFRENSLRVQSRVFTFGSWTADASNIGTASTQIVRLTKDRYNFDLEAGHIDQKKATCQLDHNTGTDKGNESWFLEGQTPWKDALRISGSGLELTAAGLTVDDSLLSNPGFQSFGNTAAAPDDITDWTSSATVNSTNYAFDSTNTFRPGPSDGSTTYSLRVKASTNLTQKLTVPGEDLDADLPYIMAVATNAERYSAVGSLELRMGNVSTTVTVNSEAGWVISLVPSGASFACWYRVFAEDDLQIDLNWTRTSGDLLIAEVLLVPGTYHDGTYQWILPASAAVYTAPRTRDVFTATDVATEAIIQKWLGWAWSGFYLPHANGSSITWTEP